MVLIVGWVGGGVVGHPKDGGGVGVHALHLLPLLPAPAPVPPLLLLPQALNFLLQYLEKLTTITRGDSSSRACKTMLENRVAGAANF